MGKRVQNVWSKRWTRAEESGKIERRKRTDGNNDAEADRAKRLMATQASAYAVEITDAATLQAYRDGGVEYVRWISEDDGRTCPTCAERNGVIYPIDEIPAKPHINCRCRVEVVKEDVAGAGESGKIEESEKAGQDNVEKALSTGEGHKKIKGSPMNTEEALKGTNPHYDPTDWGYSNNCQRCVQAYELRRRGYNVVAKSKPFTGNDVVWGNECFKQSKFEFSKTEAEVKNVMKNAPEGSRYVKYAAWKGSRKAHVFIGEKQEGVVRYIDPQNGETNVSYYFSEGIQGEFGYFRMDDKEITDDLVKIRSTVEGS